MPPLHLH